MEGEEYNGRRRTQAEKWDLYKRLRVVANQLYDLMIAGDVARKEVLEIEQRNIEDALAREERGEHVVFANYNLEWLNEPIKCSKYNTLDNFLQAFEADKVTIRLLRRGVWLVPKKKYCTRRSRTKVTRGDEI